ncbi:MAG: NAD(P)-dependent oxidoreductase [Gemmatimonadota bacterium]|nr:NAD(P)-dependent oxidoreductase [Gemmatimonadota bacterium]
MSGLVTEARPNGPKAAFIGLGAIGLPMARHTASGTTLAVWNRTRSKAALFATETGARDASSPADAVIGAELLLTCMPTSAEVEQVLFGHDGAAQNMQPGAIVIDCTSGDPATSRRIAARLASAGIEFIDAPVSGGVAGAETAKLTVMVGGDAQTLGRVRWLLELFASRIVHCGAVGSGDAVKAVNNALLAVHLWSTAEGLATLARLGVDPAVALEVINASSGKSNASMNLFPERVLNRSFPRTFRLALLDKDVRIAAEIARELGVPAELIELTARLIANAHAELGEDADHVEAVKLVEVQAGVVIESRT